MTMHHCSSHIPHTSHSPSPSLVSVVLLCLCLIVSLPSAISLPYNGRTNNDDNPNRRSYAFNPSPASPDAPPVGPSVVDAAQSDLTPNSHSHLARTTPHIPSNPADSLSPPASQGDAPPSRIRAHSQDGSLYAQQRRNTRPHSKRTQHDQADEVPIDTDPLPTTPTTTLVPDSPHTTRMQECLTAEQLSKAKKQARASLLAVMDKYLSAWQSEEKSDSEIETLYEAKKSELKEKLADKKQQLLSRACPGVVREEGTEKSERSGGGGGGARRLLGLDDDDWLDQEDEKVYLIDEGSATVDDGSASLSDDDTGTVARIVAGGARAEESSDEDDAPRFDASIHPYAMPSAFTSPSERDIEALHSPPPAPQPKPRPVSPVVEHHVDDEGEIGFIASISPARYSPAPLDNPPVIVVGQRSQRDMDEDLEEERRKRRERLRQIRSRSTNGLTEASQPVAVGSLPLSDEQLPPGGFVASISPMAPQRATVMDGDDDELGSAYVGSIGSISAPSIKPSLTQRSGGGAMSLEDRWRREEEEERKAEEGGGVWRSGSRGRLERVFTHSRQE